MLYKRICMILCALFACLFMTLYTQVFAASSDDAEMRSPWDAISLEVVKEEPSVGPISCFDVSVNGQVALGFQANNNKTVAVYSEGGEFLYGYSFKCYGSYYVFWEKDHLCIYFVRDRMAVTVDEQGNCIAVNSAVDSDHLKTVMSASKELDGVRYYLESDIMIGDRYGRLCVQKPDGSEYVFYDATELHNARAISTIFAVTLFVSAVLIAVVRREHKKLSTG